ncbi:MAG: ATP-binding cassette domain-containing protein [Eubacterium sp.]|nr:ATP-binding cassette domain-containing protein [Eubacterium sp.]
MSNVAQENAPLLNAIGLKKYYPVKKGMFAKAQQVKALDGVSFSLERGKTLAVVGESGCGKSTLGRLLTMIEEPTEGELYYNGQNFLVNDHETKALRRQKIQILHHLIRHRKIRHLIQDIILTVTICIFRA